MHFVIYTHNHLQHTTLSPQLSNFSMVTMSLKSITFLLLLVIIFFSIQAHARESQLFGKVSRSTITANPTSSTTIEKEEDTTRKQPDQEPPFIPQTQNGNYGLYTQQYIEEDSNTQTPTTTKLTTSPRTVTTQETQEYNANNDNHYYYYRPNTNNDANDEELERLQQEEDRFVQTSLRNAENSRYPSNTNPNQYYYNSNNNNVEKQGMSDTRFLENGRYFYDVQNEKNMYYNPNSQSQSTGSRYTTTTTTPQGYYYNNNINKQFSEYMNPTENFPVEEEFHAGENEQYLP